MKFKEYLAEIERISKGSYTGGQAIIDMWCPPEFIPGLMKKAKPLPGNDEFVYAVTDDAKMLKIEDGHADVAVLIFDKEKQKPVGCLTMEYLKNSKLTKKLKDLPNHLQEDTISVSEKYRGKKIATSLYGIVLSLIGKVLVSDDMHTTGGEAMWKNLIKIPGVAIYAIVRDSSLFKNPKLVINPELRKICEEGTPDELDHYFKNNKGCGRYVFDENLLVFPARMQSNGEITSNYVEVYGNDNYDVCLIAKFGAAVKS